MPLPHVNYLAVLVAAVVMFAIGGLWYSPVLFARRWMVLMGKSEQEFKAAAATTSMPLLYIGAFICELIAVWVLAIVINHFSYASALRGAEVAVLCWIGFTGATSFVNALFSMQPKPLWLINSAYYLVSFVIAGAILGAWR